MRLAAVRLLADLSDKDTQNVLTGSIILIVILLFCFGGVYAYRRWMREDETTTDVGFTLSDFRRIHKEGKMTTEEYERAKAMLIGSLKKPAAVAKPKEGPKTDPPGFDV